MSKKEKEFDGLDIFDPNMKTVSDDPYDGKDYPIVDENQDEEEGLDESEQQDEKGKPNVKETEDVENDDEKEGVEGTEEEVEESNDDSDTDDMTDEDLKSIESPITNFVKAELHKELGWEFSDDDKIESVKDLVEYMQELVEESAKPVYASPEIEKLNEYVLQGGKLEDYFKATASDVDISKLNINKKSDQITILRTLYKEQGMSEDKISRRIDRYDETGVLEEEAEDGLEALEKLQAKKAEKLLQEQQKISEQRQEQQQKFYTNVTNTIQSIKSKDLYGVEPSKVEREALIKDIFQTDNEGLTRYQREYAKNPELNLIRSAYAVLYGDKIPNKLDKKATTKAVRNLKDSLKTVKTKKTKSDSNIQQGKPDRDSLLSVFG